MRHTTMESGPRGETADQLGPGDHRPKVMLVGGPDVNARVELMQELDSSFSLMAAGSSREVAGEFGREGYEYAYYPLTRRMNPVTDRDHWRFSFAFSGITVLK